MDATLPYNAALPYKNVWFCNECVNNEGDPFGNHWLEFVCRICRRERGAVERRLQAMPESAQQNVFQEDGEHYAIDRKHWACSKCFNRRGKHLVNHEFSPKCAKCGGQRRDMQRRGYPCGSSTQVQLPFRLDRPLWDLPRDPPRWFLDILKEEKTSCPDCPCCINKMHLPSIDAKTHLEREVLDVHYGTFWRAIRAKIRKAMESSPRSYVKPINPEWGFQDGRGAPPQWFIDHARQMKLVCGACIQCVQVHGIRPVAPPVASPRTLQAACSQSAACSQMKSTDDLQESLHYEDLWDEYQENLHSIARPQDPLPAAEWV